MSREKGDILETHLERAEDALARCEDDEALGHLLEAWKECQAEPIIALIQRLSDHRVAGLTPLSSSAPRGRIEEARHAMDLPRVLAGLMEEVTRRGFCVPGHELDVLRRRFPADPRMVPLVLASARKRDAEKLDNLRMHSAVLMYVGAPFDVEPLRELRARLPEGLGREAERLDSVIRLGERWVPPVLGASAQARCDALKEAVEARIGTSARTAATREELFARVHAAPEDDEARKVLADVLLEQGDPLGEFIMLQCSSTPDEARIATLLDAHRARWQAPLGPHVERGLIRFERGFPVAVQLEHAASVPFAHCFTAPEPAWSTVEELALDGSSHYEKLWAAMLNAPALRNVKTLLRASGPTVGALKAPRESALQRVELSSTEGEGVLETLEALPRLRWLKVTTRSPEFVLRCLGPSMASRLESFEGCKWVTHEYSFLRPHDHMAWRIVLSRDAEVPVSVIVGDFRDTRELVPLLGAATRFSTRALRVCFRFEWMRRFTLDAGPEIASQVVQGRRILEEAASAYTQVLWEEA
ncbi:TIGR02996 domain-containing protein [Myxococcus stipitatus]|uniref:TIGR02996 domain-containing protein n=1 Tax=Myxococcus stipitatus TaxID=83455 RepID=UPI0031455F47